MRLPDDAPAAGLEPPATARPARSTRPEAAADAPERLAEVLGADALRPAWRRPGPWIAALLALALVAGVLLALRPKPADLLPSYVSEPVSRGTLRLSVNATGTLQPTRTVNVGSELSGTVAKVAVDLNDVVKRGQVLVELDTSKLRDQIARSRATLASRQATVAQAQATLKESESTLARYRQVAQLSGGKVPSKTELDTAEATLDRAQADLSAARAAVADAQAALRTDETNLSKASIRSPIDGVVLTRSVDPGNAVAASLQAVTLFTLAEDLSKLQLQVKVDEADVGAVRVGQRAEFTVSAYPNRRFPATITRVAYGSTTTDNVVTYVTYLDVDNADLSLRPGMTASATITATERVDVLMVPNTALRFTPAAELGPAASAPGGAPQGGSFLSRLVPRPPSGAVKRSTQTTADGQRQVWLLQDGQAVSVPVETGLSDGRRTEVRAEGLKEGDAVIVDQRSSGARR